MQQLPDEIFKHHIFQYLPSIQVLSNCLLVCKYWQSIINQTELDIDLVSPRMDLDDYMGTKIMKACTEYASNIHRLDLEGNKIGRKSIELLAAGLVNLKELNISSNRIDSGACYYLAKELRFLRILNVSHNSIGNEGLEYLMSGNLVELERLECTNVKINDEGTMCFAATTCGKLAHLNLGGNNISVEGCKNVALLSSLTSLNLSDIDVSVAAMENICKGKLENLTKLRVDNSNLNDGAIECLCKLANFKLSSLDIRINQVTNEGADMIAKSMNAHLKVLNIAHNSLETLGILSLLFMDNIESINIEKNSNHGHTILSSTLPISKVTHFSARNILTNDLISLVLNNNLKTLHVALSNLTTESIELISTRTQLTSLDVANNKLCDTNVKTIATKLSNLTNLSVAGNELTYQSMEYISSGSLLKLKTLNISSNNVGAEGAKALFLGNTTKLHILIMNFNQIGEGITYLNNTTLKGLTFLLLRSNQIGKYLKGVSFNALPKLGLLDLSNNDIGTEEFACFSQQKFPLLSTLNCGMNAITRVSVLIETLSSNFPSLKHLNLQTNPMTQKSKEEALKMKLRLSSLIQ